MFYFLIVYHLLPGGCQVKMDFSYQILQDNLKYMDDYSAQSPLVNSHDLCYNSHQFGGIIVISFLLVIIYLSFISLGLPEALLGASWPTMYQQFHVPVSYAGIISMIICLGTIFSSLQSDRLTRALGPGKVTAISVGITAAALLGFSHSSNLSKHIT